MQQLCFRNPRLIQIRTRERGILCLAAVLCLLFLAVSGAAPAGEDLREERALRDALAFLDAQTSVSFREIALPADDLLFADGGETAESVQPLLGEEDGENDGGGFPDSLEETASFAEAPSSPGSRPFSPAAGGEGTDPRGRVQLGDVTVRIPGGGQYGAEPGWDPAFPESFPPELIPGVNTDGSGGAGAPGGQAPPEPSGSSSASSGPVHINVPGADGRLSVEFSESVQDGSPGAFGESAGPSAGRSGQTGSGQSFPAGPPGLPAEPGHNASLSDSASRGIHITGGGGDISVSFPNSAAGTASEASDVPELQQSGATGPGTPAAGSHETGTAAERAGGPPAGWEDADRSFPPGQVTFTPGGGSLTVTASEDREGRSAAPPPSGSSFRPDALPPDSAGRPQQQESLPRDSLPGRETDREFFRPGDSFPGFGRIPAGEETGYPAAAPAVPHPEATPARSPEFGGRNADPASGGGRQESFSGSRNTGSRQSVQQPDGKNSSAARSAAPARPPESAARSRSGPEQPARPPAAPGGTSFSRGPPPPPQRRAAPAPVQKKPDPADAAGGDPESEGGSGARAALYTAAAAAALVLFLTLRKAFAKNRRRPAPRQADEDEEAPAAAAQAAVPPTEDEADRLARLGRYTEAMHALLLRSLADLHLRLRISFSGSLTSREILRRVQISARTNAALADMVGRVELAWFGQRRTTEDDFLACRASYRIFISGVGGGGEKP